MNLLRRLVPHPATSTLILIAWLLLQRSVSPGHLVLGAVLAVLMPLFTRRFWPERIQLGRAVVLARFLAVVLWDIVIANFSVARLVLASTRRLQPGFVKFELELDNDFALTALANTVSLTPGTVSAEVSADRQHLIVHYLAEADEVELVETIRRRYEAPLKEIFQC